ncbi:MAG: ureidoglycolate lyase [Alphaproteobacteria bacterium]|nr:ureidoglycolate lyase [Alphaproteobacteria bacterium]
MKPPASIHAEPLTAAAFAPFGDVIEGPRQPGRADDLARVLAGGDGRPMVSVLRAEAGAELPLTVARMERHPLGSQAFVPIGGGRFFVVVAPAGEFEPAAIRAFVANGRQGINYKPGTWHHGFFAEKAGAEFLIVERHGPGENCDFVDLAPTIEITA